MDDIPSWLIKAFRNRIDVLLQRMVSHPRHRAAWEEEFEWLERLRKTFSDEQRRLFGVWEDRAAYQEASEKEEMYFRGFLDGFHMFASLEEWINRIRVDERFESKQPPSSFDA